MQRRSANSSSLAKGGILMVSVNGQSVPFGSPFDEQPGANSSAAVSATAYDSIEKGQGRVEVSSDLLGNTVKDSVHAKLLNDNLSLPSKGANPLSWWAHMFVGVAMLLLGIFSVVMSIWFTKLRVTLYSSFRRWNSGLGTFDVALEPSVDVRLDFMVAFGVPFVLALYHFLFAFGFSRKIIEDFIASGRNPVRIFFHAVALGILMAATIFVCGSSDVFLFFGMWIVYALYQGAILFIEYCNPPKAGVGSNKPLTYWGPVLAAAVAILSIAAACIIHFAAMSMGDERRVPVYAWWVILFGHFCLVAHLLMYIAYVFFSIFDNYIYIDIGNGVFEVFYTVGIVVAMMFGWA